MRACHILRAAGKPRARAIIRVVVAMRVTLFYLRLRAPTWTWRGERAGFGWNYVGTKDDRRVVVKPCFSSEDIPADWWVSEVERPGVAYSMERLGFWLLGMERA